MDDTWVWVLLVVLIFLFPVVANLLWASFHPDQRARHFTAGTSPPALPPQEGRIPSANQAELAAVDWLAESDAGAYAACWQRAAVQLRNRIARPNWEQQMQGVRTPLGAVELRNLQSAEITESLPGAVDGTYVVVQFQTQFEHKKAAIEVVTMEREVDAVWRVAGYFIR